ncbi:MAG TPA: class I SAM-dependent methyltransferase [Bryobacteraceae bacterium]|nr:class I SAM-dependent methyltransferase [Bryobacteraceae bacterium]
MRLITPEEFAKLAKAEKDHWWHRGMRSILFRLLDPMIAGRDVHRALDVGWGTGHLARLLQARYDWHVFPIAAAWEGQLGMERMVEGSVAALPFAGRSFDAAFLMDVLGHVPPDQVHTVLGEITRLLRPKGLFIVRVPALDIFRGRMDGNSSERQRFTRERLVNMLENHGLRVLRSSYVNAAFAPVALAKFKLVEPLLGRPVPVGPVAVPYWVDRLCSMPLAFESFWLGMGMNLPLGQTLLAIAERED